VFAAMTDTDGLNAAQAAYWEERASSWGEVETYTSSMMGPFGQRAMDRLPLEPGHRVLDIGCGGGLTTVELARRVAPGGTTVGIDISPSMIETARARAREEHVDVELVVGDAQVHDLGEATFDAAYSRFGVMFFADPVVAFANIRRALRDGGRLAFACWQAMAANEWMRVPGEAVTMVTGVSPPPPTPGEPGPFVLSDPDRTTQILSAAGFRSIKVTPESGHLDVGVDRLDFAVDVSLRLGAIREAVAANADPAFREELQSAVRTKLEEHVRDGRLVLGSAGYVVSADA
jgi:SAM-dependent methyltransferase